MLVYECQVLMKVGEAPVGLLRLAESGEIIMKTEYRLDGKCECYLVSSGEKYWGKGDEADCYPLIIE